MTEEQREAIRRVAERVRKLGDCVAQGVTLPANEYYKLAAELEKIALQ
jgi:hypothetical protein